MALWTRSKGETIAQTTLDDPQLFPYFYPYPGHNGIEKSPLVDIIMPAELSQQNFIARGSTHTYKIFCQLIYWTSNARCVVIQLHADISLRLSGVESLVDDCSLLASPYRGLSTSQYESVCLQQITPGFTSR